MADQPGQSQDMGYERLGEAKLSLVDVIAQSVGFMGPVFSAAFLIPLIVGANVAAKGAGVAAPLSVLIAAIGVFALGWIVAQYAKKIHAAGSLYDYVSAGLGNNVGAAAGWLYYSGTMVLTAGLGVLIGGYIHDSIFTSDPAVPGVFSAESPLPIWAWSALFALAGVRGALLRGADLDAGAIDAGVGIGSGRAGLLRQGDHRRRQRQRRGNGVQPATPRRRAGPASSSGCSTGC